MGGGGWVRVVVLSLSWTLVANTTARAQSAGSAEGDSSGVGSRDRDGEGRSEVMSIPRLASPPDFDGFVDDAAWEGVAPLPVVQYWPTPGGEMAAATEIRVGYDDEYFYASGRFFDIEGGVRANSYGRDRWDGDDAFDLVIDSYNDNETALKFTVMPLGAILDEEVQNDANQVGSQWPLNVDWNGYWEARTQQTEDGWFAEVRIPMSSLGFEGGQESVVMGLIAARYIARLDEKHIFPAITPDIENAEFKPSLAQDVELVGVEGSAPLYVTPYLLLGADRTRDFDDPVPPEASVPSEAGLDVKWGLNSNLTLDLTLNTDFAQVESDALQVNLDRFNLFFPEKRQFFQERAGVFQFQLGDEGRLFHSRRIGLGEDGTPRRILGGARLVGRVGEWDVGLLSMQVGGEGRAPGENDAALRLRRSFLNEGSSFGAMVTTRVPTEGGMDTSVGVDSEVQVGGSDFVTAQLAHTRNDGAAGAFAERSLARVRFERRRATGLAWDNEVSYSGSAYDPRLGFEERGNFTALKTRFLYSWSPERSRVVRHRTIFAARAFRGTDGRGFESALGRLRYQASFRGGHFWNTALNFTWDRVDEVIDLPGGHVDTGTYGGVNLYTNVWLNRAMPLSGEGNVWAGQFMDGWRFHVRMAPTWVASRHLSLTAAYSVHRLWFPSRDQRVDADEATLRLTAAVNARLSADTFVQYSMAAERVAANFRVRYRFSEGRDLYLVLDGARDIVDTLEEDLRVLGRSDRRLLVKYAHTFRR